MALTSETSKTIFTCTGGTTYDFTFKVFDETDLEVIRLSTLGVETVLALSTGYTVSLLTETGGRVTTIATYSDGQLVVRRSQAKTQDVDYSQNDILSTEVLEEQLDKLVMMIQEIKEQVDRSILGAATATEAVTLPEGSANKLLSWNSAGTALENVTNPAVAAAASASAAADDADDAETARIAAVAAQGLAESAKDTATTKAGEANASAIAAAASAASLVLPTELAILYPSLYQRDQKWALKTAYSTAANRYTILTPNKLSVDINGTIYFLTAQAEIALSLEANWDTIAGTDYRTAANRAGKDFYIYACVPVSGSTPKIVLSANSTTPSGYTGTTSRKIGGFHGLCVDVGAIGGHTLTGFLAGDVLPASIWDLSFKPKFANPEGMVYSDGVNKWVDIYLASGTGASTVSVYGGTISDTRNWMDFADDGGAVKKKMLDDAEFQIIAAGSNEETNITGSGDPGTTGGHVDTAARRMISNIGVEDACGALYQWLSTQSYFYTGTTGYQGNLPGGKGSYYTNYTSDPGASEMDNSDAGSDVKLFAGGYWDNAAFCGSRYRSASSYRWVAHAYIGCRFCAEPV